MVAMYEFDLFFKSPIMLANVLLFSLWILGGGSNFDELWDIHYIGLKPWER